MLISKINPPAKKTTEINPFSSTTENLEYMTAVARPYVPGADRTNFQVQFGTVTLDESNIVNGFNNQLDSQLTLTKDELGNWGTNDEALLTAIAAKLGVSILSFSSVDKNNF